MSPAAHPHLIRAVSTFNLLLYHKFCDLSSNNFAQIFPKTALKFYTICILTFISRYCIISISNEREVMIMMELYLFGGIYVGGLLLAGFIAVASIYAQKHPNKKFSKWWYND